MVATVSLLVVDQIRAVGRDGAAEAFRWQRIGLPVACGRRLGGPRVTTRRERVCASLIRSTRLLPMPVLPRPYRRALIGPVAAVLLLAGCESLDDANRAVGRTDLVNDLATRLDRSGTLTYSADYQLPGGRTGAIAQAQRPARTAYVYPGGKLTVAADAIAQCATDRARPICTLTTPPQPDGRPALAAYADTGRHGLIAPPVVMNLLADAALDPAAEITQSDTTVAGRHATCVGVRNLAHAAAAKFDVCVTTEGVLGKFVGVVDGHSVDVALTGYRDGVDRDVFELPAGAGVTDRRAGAK
jgi:hypothetical protein